MKRCSAKPYEGGGDYIFVSYCHKDRAQIFPIIERLCRDGYRVWYDEGIDPGSEWPEIIAANLNGSAACVAFLSENSLNSHNCRREINFALLKKKFFISVVIEPVQMSLGMEMQLSSTQSIIKYQLSSDEEFFEKLCSIKGLEKCLGAPDPSIVVSSPSDYEESADSAEIRDPFSDRWFVSAADRPPDGEASDKTVLLRAGEESAPESPAPEHLLKRENTGERIRINKNEFILGRSETQADYVIRDNSRVSRAHAVIYLENGKCYLADNGSLNKTFLNDRPLPPREKHELKNNDSVKIANESFIYLFSE